MSKDKRSISFRQQTAEAVEKIISPLDFSARVDNIVSDYMDLIKLTKIELVNYFTEKEASLIIDASNMAVGITQISPVLMLNNYVADAITMLNLDKKYGVDKSALFDKIMKLTAFQAYTVLQMVAEVWNSEDPNAADIKSIFMIKDN